RKPGQRHRQATSGTSRRGDSRVPSARAVQGQGGALRRRACRDQGNEEEIGRTSGMSNKYNVDPRIRRARKTRIRIAEQRATRLTVGRSNAHIYAQIIAPTGDKVLASASTLEADVRKTLKNGGNKAAAVMVGKRIAEKAKA